MQLNVHVPKDREQLLYQLDRLAEKQHQPKNQLVLNALQQYLRIHQLPTEASVSLPVVRPIGVIQLLNRADLYEEYLDTKYGRTDDPA
ncbi:MAG: hypothetical protein ACREN8_07105 [Candidatus Dormibacteraceae bacterium]